MRRYISLEILAITKCPEQVVFSVSRMDLALEDLKQTNSFFDEKSRSS